MRKLLLSTLAGLVAACGMADLARAQTAPPAPSTVWTVVPFAIGVAGNNGGVPVGPAPGTVAVNLGGLFQWMLNAAGSSSQSYKGQKVANYDTLGFTRLFFGMDGQSTNGIFYGTEWQLRQNFGIGSASAAGTSSTGTGNSTFYLRSAYGYVKTPSLGTIRVGPGSGPVTLYETGMFESFNDGAYNGDLTPAEPASSLPLFPYDDNGIMYTTDKIVYLSPAIAGFEVGIAYEPALATLNDNTCSTGAAGALSSCDNLSSSNIAADAGRRRNLVDFGVRYRGAFGPVGVAVNGGYIGSGVVNYTGAVSAGSPQYHGMSLGHVGTEITIGGLMVGGHYMYGAQNGQWSLEPVGGVPSTSYLVGTQYTVGPVVFGTSFFENWGTGDFTTPKTEGQRVENGLAVGGYYALTPGLGFFFSYLYGTRKQSGYDFLAGTSNVTAKETNGINNQVKEQLAGVGISLQW